MKKAIISFVVSALIGLGIGYIVFEVIGGSNEASEVADTKDSSAKTTTETKDTKEDETVAADADAGILGSRGCIGCHAVDSLNLAGGATGPDLSQSFNTVEDKHGKPIDQFLKEPTSAVMSGVIGGDPLSDEEMKEVLEMLKKASEAK